MGTFVGLDILEAAFSIAHGIEFLAGAAAMRGATCFRCHRYLPFVLDLFDLWVIAVRRLDGNPYRTVF